MPNDGTNLLEVPGNRLPETGFMPGMINQAECSSNNIGSCTEATWITKAQKLSRQSIGPDFPATAEG
ncbi:hypothetical protein GQ457_18G007220 [Hibiscus cannabinus]